MLLALTAFGACTRSEKAVRVHASFTTDKDVYDLNEPVFINNTSTVENGVIGVCKWTWGEDNVSFEDEIDCISFNDVGDYVISLTVYADGGGGRDTFSKSVKIVDASEPETGIIHVTIPGAGVKDGSSWDNAMGVEEFKTALSGDLSQFAENTFRLQSGTYALGDAPLALNGSAEGALLRISGGFSPTGGVTSDPTVFSGDNAHGIFTFSGKIHVLFTRCALQNTPCSVITLDDPNVTVELNRSSVSGGKTERGGGVNITAGTLIANNTTFSNNEATEEGGGIYAAGGTLELSSCTISDNTAKNGGGMAYMAKTNLVFSEENPVVFSANGAKEEGGGLYYCADTNLDLSCCTFNNNKSEGNGGGLSNKASGFLSAVACTFDGNFAALFGGGVYDDNTNAKGAEYVGCTFKNNDGGIRDAGSTSRNSGGGGVAMGAGKVKIQACTFENNFGQFGGALEAAGDCTADIEQCTFTGNKTNMIKKWNCYGGVLYINQSSALNSLVRFNKCFMTGNMATAGAITYQKNGGTIYMNSCVMYDNYMNYQCGAVIQNAGGNIYLNNCSISKAYTTHKLSTYVNAAWIYLIKGSTNIFNSSIIGETYHNTSTYTGSAGLISVENADTHLHLVNNIIASTYYSESSPMQALTAKAQLTGSQTYLYNKMSSVQYALDENKITLTCDPGTLNGTDYLATANFFQNMVETTGNSYNSYYWGWDGTILSGTNSEMASTEDVNNAILSVSPDFHSWLDEIGALGKDQRGKARGATSWPGAYDNGAN